MYAASKNRFSDNPACPSCGREAIATATGQCVYCLRAVDASTHVEPGRILTLHDLERTRERVRGADGRRRMRLLLALAMGVGVASAVVGLFGVALRWATSFFARGMVTG